MKRSLIFIALLLGLTYVSDWILLRYRILKNQPTFDTVLVQRYIAIAEKNNRMEFIAQDPESIECVRALYPHGGDIPCWYARRKKEERLDE